MCKRINGFIDSIACIRWKTTYVISLVWEGHRSKEVKDGKGTIADSWF